MERERQRIAEMEKERLKGPPPVELPELEGTPILDEEKFKPPENIPVELPEQKGTSIPEVRWEDMIFTQEKAEDDSKPKSEYGVNVHKSKEEIAKEIDITRENLGPYITLNNLSRLKKKSSSTKPSYALQLPGKKGSNTRTFESSTDLNALKAKRDAYFEKLKKQQGELIDQHTFEELIRSKEIKIGKKDNSDTPTVFAERFNIKFKTVGNKIFYDTSSLTDKRLEEIRRRRVPQKEKIEVAKQLIEDQGIKTRNSLNRALKEAGYQIMGKVVLNREFPNLMGDSWSEREHEIQDYYGKKAKEKRAKYLETYSGMGAEKAIIRIKRTLGYGPDVHLMHRKKKTENIIIKI
jgi:hypothetical protein